MAGGSIYLVDNDGKTASTTINAKGKFSITTEGLTAPFLLKATSKDSTVTLYGFAVANGTANVDVYTDSIVSMVYAALSTNPNTQFGLAAPVPSGLSPSSFSNNLSLTSTTTQNLITSWLLADKVKTSNFNLLDNKFAVNNSKFGKLLRQTTIKTPLTIGVEKIEITDNITVEDITFTGTPPVGGSFIGTVSGTSSTSINSSNPLQPLSRLQFW